MDRARIMFRALPLVIVVLTALLIGPSAASADTAVAGADVEYTENQLSDEQVLSRWAFVTRRTFAYSEPRGQGRKVRRLTTRTPDGTHELVLALRERVYVDGQVWVEVRLPMRGSNRKGWVRRGVLEKKYRANRYRLEISRSRFRAKLYKSDRLVWSARIGIGKKGTVTPKGNFYIRNRLITTNPRGPYGPYAFGLSAYSKTLTDWPGGGIIGIHGTNQPGILPGRVSHGCIRIKNSKIRRLYKLLPAGTPVKIT